MLPAKYEALMRKLLMHVWTLARVHWPILLPFALVAIALRAWLMPGVVAGDDFFAFPSDLLKTYFPWRHMWDGTVLMGRSNGPWSPGFPLWSIAGLLAHFGFGWSASERVVWLWPFLFLSVMAPYALTYAWTRMSTAAALSAMIFSLNTWTISLVQRGHIPSLDAYALMPLVVLVWWRWLRHPTPLGSLLWGALLTLQVMFDLRYAYISVVACAAFALVWIHYRSRGSQLARALPNLLWALAALAVFNLFWLLPQLAAPLRLPAGYDTTAGFIAVSSFESLAHSVALFSPFYHYVQGTNGFVVNPVERSFYVLPIALVLALVVSWRSRPAKALAILAMLSIVIVAGPLSPLGSFDRWLFIHVPGMKFFRDISKFTALEAFVYASAIGLGWWRLWAWLRGPAPVRSLSAAALVIVTVGYAALMHDAFNPLRFSNFAPLRVTVEDQELQRFLDNQPEFFRTLVFPTQRQTLLSSDVHPLVAADYFFNALPQDGGVGDTFADGSTLLQRFASALTPQWLAQASVRYVIVTGGGPDNVYAPYFYGIQYAQSVDFFRHQRWLHEVAHFGNDIVFALPQKASPLPYVAQQPTLLIGSAQSLNALAASPLWNERAGVVIASQLENTSAAQTMMQQLQSAVADNSVLPNATGEVPLSDKNKSALARLMVSQTLRQRAWAATQPVPPAGGDSLGLLSFTFESARGTAIPLYGVDAFINSRIPVVRKLLVRAGETMPSSRAGIVPLIPGLTAVELLDPNIIRAPFDYPKAGNWLGLAGARCYIRIINLGDSPLLADIELPSIVAANPSSQPVRMSINGTIVDFQAPGANDFDDRGASTILRDVRLNPGSNTLQLGLAGPATNLSGFALFFDQNIAIAHVRATSVSSGSSAYRRSYFSIFRDLRLPLDRRPRLTLEYKAPRAPMDLYLLLDFSYGDRPKLYEYPVNLSSAESTFDGDLSEIVQNAYDDQWQRERGLHQTDAVWMSQPSHYRSAEASALELRAVRVAFVAPASSGLAPSNAALRKAQIDLAATEFAPNAVARRPRDLLGRSLAKIDGKENPISSARVDWQQQRVLARGSSLKLDPGTHSFQSLKTPSYRVNSIFLMQGEAQPASSPNVSHFARANASEYTFDVASSGGLLVLPQAYSPFWRLRLQNPEQQPQVIPSSDHVAVNDIWNGWILPSGRYHAVVSFYPESYSRLGAVLSVVLSTLLIMSALLRGFVRKAGRRLS